MTQVLKIGNLVRIKGDSPVGPAIAFVYDTYQDFDDKSQTGVSLITKEGRDTGGWSKEEQDKYLEFIEDSGCIYKFRNVIQLDRDFNDGIFNSVFAKFKFDGDARISK